MWGPDVFTHCLARAERRKRVQTSSTSGSLTQSNKLTSTSLSLEIKSYLEMEVDVFTNTYNKHAKKAWKKTKCKRQVRKIGKTMEKDL